MVRAKAWRSVAVCVHCVAVLSAGQTLAQDPAPQLHREVHADSHAAELFQRGRDAFGAGYHETALDYFERAHEMSGRAELLYDIGVVNDRLGRTEAALRSFERYLKESDEPTRDEEVRARIAALRRLVHAGEPSQVDDGGGPPTQTDSRRRRAAVVGGASLMVVGAAGIGAAIAGVLRDGRCVSSLADGTCAREKARAPGAWVYGSIGAAALLAGAVWTGVGVRRNKTITVGIGPGSIRIAGVF